LAKSHLGKNWSHFMPCVSQQPSFCPRSHTNQTNNSNDVGRK